MDHNCHNIIRPGWKKRALNCLIRTARSVIGMIIIAGIATVCIRYFQESKLNDKCARLRMELERLKHRRVEAREAAKPSKTEMGNRGCSSGNHDDCPFPDREIRDIIRQELSLHHADKTGMPDFALENLGGCVLSTRDTKHFCEENTSIMTIFSKPDSIPNRILRPDVTPGNCWAFEGHQGTAVIKLWSYVFITYVTLEHISPTMSPSGDITSAPKTFTLWGLQDPDDHLGKHKFGSFEYKKGANPVQTFPVQHPINKSYRIVEVTFHDNHGNVKYTCVYRVRIHGKIDRAEGKVLGKTPS